MPGNLKRSGLRRPGESVEGIRREFKAVFKHSIIMNIQLKLSEGKLKEMGTESEQQTERDRDGEGGVAREVVISPGKLGSRLV